MSRRIYSRSYQTKLEAFQQRRLKAQGSTSRRTQKKRLILNCKCCGSFFGALKRRLYCKETCRRKGVGIELRMKHRPQETSKGFVHEPLGSSLGWVRYWK